jgi:hypothetical protein
MGLDMYLYKKHYVGNKYKPAEKRIVVSVPNQEGQTFAVGSIKSERIQEITEEVAYWRKANSVHKWFVDNVQDGEDNCHEYSVSRKQLKDLSDLCKTVIASSILVAGTVKNGERYENGAWVPILVEGEKVNDPTSAKILLPTTKGFFFGSQDYDEEYVADLKTTVEQLDAILAEPEDGADFIYQSSW